MTLCVYADFNDPLAHLLSQRLERVPRPTWAEVRWCAVQREPGMPVAGRRLDERAEHDLLAEVASLALPGEAVPEHLPVLPNTFAATSAYAEAVSDGYELALRRALFAAAFGPGPGISAAEDVRRVVVGVTLPETADVVTARSARWAPLGVPDPTTVVRQLGGTTTRLGGPVTTVAQRRVDRWRQQWVGRGAPRGPLLLTPLGEMLVGAQALAWLARQLPATTRTTSPRRLSVPRAAPLQPAGV